MLELIHNDHKNLAILIQLLRERHAALVEKGEVNYSLIRDVVDYMQEYADKYHHKVEDVVYDYYLTHKCQQSSEGNKLSVEHKKLELNTDELRTMLDMILNDCVIPLDQFADKLGEFIAMQQAHMDYEEQHILPELAAVMTKDDWQAVADKFPVCPGATLEEAKATAQRLDPLFGQQVAEQYKDLAKRLQTRNECVSV
ncbi:hemerythrin [Corallincola luteus]|uniref:Hemerythrin n=2 Tax=Corallincola TaxID=1775176 RepID=A0A368NPI8_9GAMM|nr:MULTISPECIES: hemerythrin domain-containing protein [Corallincola]RCU51813.1 hemerythrin [Corallincola holothuriorum]TCI04966.1 hemerythrin [Corallincola luteus]